MQNIRVEVTPRQREPLEKPKPLRIKAPTPGGIVVIGFAIWITMRQFNALYDASTIMGVLIPGYLLILLLRKAWRWVLLVLLLGAAIYWINMPDPTIYPQYR
jgi:hypothetical protein